tara:strand:- start:37 stop:840 length:804 start_codon:yes stop_codon:yes gene_type:complete
MSFQIKKAIPSIVTIANLFLGFTSIILLSLSINSEASYVSTACYLILIGCILDSLDGKLARKLDVSSDFGKEIDSLADLVSFCMVPSFLIFVFYTVTFPNYFNIVSLIFLSSFPLIFGAIRLAKYNSYGEMRDSEKYLGLPTPSNAILICSIILFVNNAPIRFILGLNKFENLIYSSLSWIFEIPYMILLISIVSSLLLMSKVNYEKFPLISFKINKQNNKDLIKVILFLVILCISIYYGDYDIILLLFISIYIFGNVIRFFINHKK